MLSDGNIASHCWFQISFVSALVSNINNDFYAILKNWRSAYTDTHINMYCYWLVSWFLFSFFLDVRWISSLCETAGFPKVKISYIIFRFRIVIFCSSNAFAWNLCTACTKSQFDYIEAMENPITHDFVHIYTFGVIKYCAERQRNHQETENYRLKQVETFHIFFPVFSS